MLDVSSPNHVEVSALMDRPPLALALMTVSVYRGHMRGDVVV
jgi:hypothetical protein